MQGHSEKRIDQFRIVREIGRGGMGVVYEAVEEPTGRHVAMKVLPQAVTVEAGLRERFEREIRTTANLNHPNIVRVYTVGAWLDQPYYTMEYIDGLSLDRAIKHPWWPSRFQSVTSGVEAAPTSSADGKTVIVPEWPDDDAVDDDTEGGGAGVHPRNREYFRFVAEIVRDTGQALDHAHRHGVIHRDVKPANILLTRDGRVRVTDFGLAIEVDAATLTRTGAMVGTPRYMSPEQLLTRRVRIDARTDVYSLGVTLYELLTLCPAFEADTRAQLLLKIAVQEPRKPRGVNPYLPRDLETIALMAMEKDPQHRYQSAQLLADDLTRFLDGEPILAAPPSIATRTWKFVRRHKILSATVAAALVFLCVGAAGVWQVQKQQRRAEVQSKVTQAEALLQNYKTAIRTAQEVGPQVEQAWRDLHGVLPGTDTPNTANLEEQHAKLEEALTKARHDADLSSPAAVGVLHQALSLEPDSVIVRSALAKLYLVALIEAETRRNKRDVAVFRRLATLYDDGALADVIEGNGTITVRTSPPRARVALSRYVPNGKRLVPRAEGHLCTTPGGPVPIAMGSYLLTIEKEGFRPVNCPVLIERGDEASIDIPLFTDQQIGEGLLYVPAGRCILGGDPEANWPLPARRALLAGFVVGSKEVTGAEYLEFLNALLATDAGTARKRAPRLGPWDAKKLWPIGGDGRFVCPYPLDHPVFGISCDDADVYCQWLSEKTGRNFRLPTSAEWERVGRGADGRLFPWGDSPSPSYTNMRSWAKMTHDDGVGPVPGGSYPLDRSPFGAYDMAGNVHEFCRDVFYHVGDKAVKGGCWYQAYERGRLTSRYRKWPGTPHRAIGFRVVCDLPESDTD